MPAHGTSFRRYLNMTDLKELNASGSRPVFAADVEGYSRLMGADEVSTLKRVRAHGFDCAFSICSALALNRPEPARFDPPSQTTTQPEM